MLVVRICLLICLFNSLLYCQGQVITIIGPNNEPLPFSVVSCSDTVMLPNSKGVVSLPDSDTCLCSHLGYINKLVYTGEIQDTIKLSENFLSFDSVEIVGSQHPKQSETIGPVKDLKVKFNTRNLHGININRGSVLTFIPNVGQESIIQSAIIYISDIRPDVLFRIRLLEVDSSGHIRDDLIYDNIYFDHETYSPIVNLSAYNISMPRFGVYVCLDWHTHDEEEREELWSLDNSGFFNVAINRRKKLATYEAYITSSLQHGLGSRINPIDPEYYFVGTPLMGLEVIEK